MHARRLWFVVCLLCTLALGSAPAAAGKKSPRFVFITAQRLLDSDLPPNWMVDHLQATDAIVFWDQYNGAVDPYNAATTEAGIRDLFRRIRAKLGSRVRFWPAWWSFNDAAWLQDPSRLHLAGAWDDEARWQVHFRNLRYISRALAETDAAGVFMDLENYGDTPAASGGLMLGAAWTEHPLVAQRARDWWAALQTHWSGKPGFYVHWSDGRRWPALQTWCAEIYRSAKGGVLCFEDSFTATVNNSNYAGVAREIRRTVGKKVKAYPGMWLDPAALAEPEPLVASLRQAFRDTKGCWLYDNSGGTLSTLGSVQEVGGVIRASLSKRLKKQGLAGVRLQP